MNTLPSVPRPSMGLLFGEVALVGLAAYMAYRVWWAPVPPPTHMLPAPVRR